MNLSPNHPRRTGRLRSVWLLSLLVHTSSLTAATIYSEDFSSPSKYGHFSASSELSNGGSYSYGTWVFSDGNGGVDNPAKGDGSGSSAANSIATYGQARAQAGRGTNARALSVILNASNFASGIEYTVSFDVIGDASGGNAGRYWLALVSGHDANNGILIDGTHNGWGSGAGSPKPFTASGAGAATIDYVQDSGSNGVPLTGETSAGTTPVSFTFTHDGVSDVAFAVGTYNNIFAIDNFSIDDPNDGNVLPTVSIVSGPGKYEEIDEGSTDSLQISASDSDGSISSIRILIDNVLIDQNTTDSSYTLENAFTSVAPGTHTLTVIATDDVGGTDSVSLPFYIVPSGAELTGQHPYTAGLSKVQEYLRFLPADYNDDPNQQWPMILWLHGAGNRGSDALSIRAAGGPPSRIRNNDPLLDDFIVLSPQCKSGESWGGSAAQNNIDTLVDEHLARFRIDPDRIIITGQSMGGRGTYTSALRHPNKYAALVPICGNGDHTQATALAHLPIWIFHGDQDGTVPYQASVDWHNALLAAGAQNSDFHTIVGGPHNVWSETYKRADLYEWMLKMSYLSKYYPSTPELAPLLEQDSDGDGRTGQQELNAGTSPTDASSVFKALPPSSDGSSRTLSWSSAPGQHYTVYRTTDLSANNWQVLQPANIPADPSQLNSIVDTSGDSAAFYRIETQR
ncbi:MAG: Ig-like domain-containing protein [Opitutales bacterium]